MKSGAEAAIYVNNSDADGQGTDLYTHLSKSKYNTATATGAVITPDGKINNTTIKKIKGRGNTTWNMPKKPFSITYSSAISVAGMKTGKKYSLLANAQDDSLSRNRFLYDLSDAVDMPYASDSRYVDFYMNGYYWGSYQLCEKIEVGKNNLISDFEEDDYLNEDGTLKDDFPFLCEIDAGADGDDYFFRVNNWFRVTVKSPELKEDDPLYDTVLNKIKVKFLSFLNAVQDDDETLTDLVDVDSVAKLLIINELSKNWDAGNSSIYFTYKQDDNGKFKFYGSPVWDYDNSLGNPQGYPEMAEYGIVDYTKPTGYWITFAMGEFAENVTIMERAREIWFEKFVPAIDHFAGKKQSEEIGKEFFTSEEYYNLVKASAEMNYTSGWPLYTSSWIADHSALTYAYYDRDSKTYYLNNFENTYPDTYEGKYNYCADWFVSRAAWLSKEYSDEIKTVIVEPEPEPETVISLKAATSSIYVKDKVTVKADVENPQGKTTYKSSNSKVAGVSADGTVTGVSAGTATITATNNGKSASIKITVKQKANTMKVTAKKTVAAKANKKTTINKAVIVKNAQGKLAFKTNNKKVKIKSIDILHPGTCKMIVNKGLKKGKTYKVKVTVSSMGSVMYKPCKKTVTIKIKVK